MRYPVRCHRRAWQAALAALAHPVTLLYMGLTRLMAINSCSYTFFVNVAKDAFGRFSHDANGAPPSL